MNRSKMMRGDGTDNLRPSPFSPRLSTCTCTSKASPWLQPDIDSISWKIGASIVEFSIRGKVREGKLDLEAPLSFPEGEDVIVRIERVGPDPVGLSDAVPGADAYVALPFFGMWADRDEAEAAVESVRRGRERWRRRLSPPD
jgi:hypothetical protein